MNLSYLFHRLFSMSVVREIQTRRMIVSNLSVDLQSWM